MGKDDLEANVIESLRDFGDQVAVEILDKFLEVCLGSSHSYCTLTAP